MCRPHVLRVRIFQKLFRDHLYQKATESLVYDAYTYMNSLIWQKALTSGGSEEQICMSFKYAFQTIVILHSVDRGPPFWQQPVAAVERKLSTSQGSLVMVPLAHSPLPWSVSWGTDICPQSSLGSLVYCLLFGSTGRNLMTGERIVGYFFIASSLLKT